MATPLRKRPVLLIATLAAALGCAISYYDEYLAAHPGFQPELPREGATVSELLAALHAPAPVESIEVALGDLRILRSDTDPWLEIPFASIRAGTAEISAESDYVVLVAWSCSFLQGLETGTAQRAGYYLLPGNRLRAYDHYRFREDCLAGNEFRAARGAQVGVEREALERIAGTGTRFTLAQAYSRGLAYVEAGRLAEAHAMLLLGERSYRSAAAKLHASGRPEALADAQRMRGALMRALGVEERRAGAAPRR